MTEFASQLAGFVGRGLETQVDPAEVRVIGAGALPVADATSKAVVPVRGFGEVIVLVSGQANPDIVARAVRNIAHVRDALPDGLRDNVPPALCEGTIGHLSCAAWAMHEPFLVNAPFRWRLHRWRYRKRLLEWTYGLCRETLEAPEDATQPGFEAALSGVAQDRHFPDDMRARADAALERLRSGAWVPFHCVQHGDLWAGNIVLAHDASSGPEFYVIDWPGMSRRGYPLFDFARLAMSLKCRGPARAAWLRRYRELLQCEAHDLCGYVLAAVGDLGRNLEYFPEALYRDMSIGVYQFMRA